MGSCLHLYPNSLAHKEIFMGNLKGLEFNLVLNILYHILTRCLTNRSFHKTSARKKQALATSTSSRSASWQMWKEMGFGQQILKPDSLLQSFIAKSLPLPQASGLLANEHADALYRCRQSWAPLSSHLLPQGFVTRLCAQVTFKTSLYLLRSVFFVFLINLLLVEY